LSSFETERLYPQYSDNRAPVCCDSAAQMIAGNPAGIRVVNNPADKPPPVKLVAPLRRLASRKRVLVLAVAVCSASPCGAGFAQDQPAGAPAIQVKTDEILVPVLVLDKKRIDAIHQMDIHSYINQVNAANSHLLMDLAVMGLAAGQFHIFEDGKEQEIQRLTLEPGWKLKLPVGPGFESLASPDTADTTRKTPYFYVELPQWPTYQISYAPPPSPVGSCHTVYVKIDRRDSYVYARSEYCNTSHAVYDMLNGTPLGGRMAADLDRKDRGPIRLMATAFSLFHANAAVYTHILLNTPREVRRLTDCTQLPEIGFLGMIYSNDGKLAARFSGRALGGGLNVFSRGFPLLAPTPIADAPCFLTGTNTFEARLDLVPGDYKLRAVIRDGKNFGRTDIPIRVKSFNLTQLAISDIALGKNHRQVAAGSQPDLAVSPDQQIPLVSKDVQILPTADTRFKTSEILDFYFEVFSPQSGSPQGKIEVYMHVLEAETGQVVQEIVPADTAPYRKPGDPVIPVGGGIDISKLQSGSYLLQARATDSTSQSTAWSSVAFSIQ
jgi:hypothetical protein